MKEGGDFEHQQLRDGGDANVLAKAGRRFGVLDRRLM
jgi:hypothetical protein